MFLCIHIYVYNIVCACQPMLHHMLQYNCGCIVKHGNDCYCILMLANVCWTVACFWICDAPLNREKIRVSKAQPGRHGIWKCTLKMPVFLHPNPQMKSLRPSAVSTPGCLCTCTACECLWMQWKAYQCFCNSCWTGSAFAMYRHHCSSCSCSCSALQCMFMHGIACDCVCSALSCTVYIMRVNAPSCMCDAGQCTCSACFFV